MTTPRPRLPRKQHQQFEELERRLPTIWKRIHASTPWEHTSVVVPSLSFHPEELAKIRGVSFYEERLLFTLMRLRHPLARVIYVTSQPIHPDIIDYYLQLLVGIPAGHARRRLSILCVQDREAVPLTRKILDRPRVVERLRRLVGDPRRAYLTCFNSTQLEAQLALQLGVPLNAVDPDQLWLGTKSGSRQAFRQAGVNLPAGCENLHGRAEVVQALADLAQARPGLKKAVVKLDESFAGEGNAVFTFPPEPTAQAIERTFAERLSWSSDEENLSAYLRKMEEMGGIVEEHIQGRELRSPSVQLRANPLGEVEIISTHDQVLGGPLGQEYLGCRFPASEEYREQIQREALAVGGVLRDAGVVSRFGIDFVVARDPGEPWRSYAIEINLRMGGTTHPFLALQFLTGGHLDEFSGQFQSTRGQPKYYFSTDSLKSPAYRGILPEDLMELATLHGLNFHSGTEKGVLFHMIGAISEFGKVGVTCIGDSIKEADQLFEWTTSVLDQESGAARNRRGRLARTFERRFPGME